MTQTVRKDVRADEKSAIRVVVKLNASERKEIVEVLDDLFYSEFWNSRKLPKSLEDALGKIYDAASGE